MDEPAAESINDIFIKKPFRGFETNSIVFIETVYGIVKRLSFIVCEIEAERARIGIKPENLKIIDIGCGTGVNITIPLAQMGYNIAGVDTDSESIERAHEMSKSLSNVKFYNSALGDLSCDEKFNVVVCSEVLEHQEKPGHLLHHIKRIIADKGSLLITIPNGYGYFNFDKLLEDLFPPLRKAVEYCADLWVKKIGTECAKLRYKYEEARQYWYICRSSLSSNNTHHIKFTSSRIRRLLEEEGFTIAKFSNNTFLSGNILQTIFRYFATPINANCRVADFLPSWLCSNWLIAANIDS